MRLLAKFRDCRSPSRLEWSLLTREGDCVQSRTMLHYRVATQVVVFFSLSSYARSQFRERRFEIPPQVVNVLDSNGNPDQ